jgi:hypothetical protein
MDEFLNPQINDNPRTNSEWKRHHPGGTAGGIGKGVPVIRKETEKNNEGVARGWQRN